MDRKDFHDILNKYLRGQATSDEKELIDTWYENMGKDTDVFLSEADEVHVGNRYWSSIMAFVRASRRSRDFGLFRWYSLGLAAAFVLIFVSYLSISYGTGEPDLKIDEASKSLVVYKKIVNHGEQADEVTLPDGSTVTLKPESRIQFASTFDGPERKVYLDGEAFFEVVPDVARPFKVYTQKVITKVLGTSFMVTAYRREKEVTVAVRSGKVSVYTKDAQDSAIASEIILTPNQKFIYDKDRAKGARSIVDRPQALVPPEEVKRMRFEEASPKTILEAIEKVYGVDIVYDEEKFSTCRITTSISDGNIFNRIHIICEVMNASYRLEEDKIVIEGDGCRSNI